jgi:hypothetical protein
MGLDALDNLVAHNPQRRQNLGRHAEWLDCQSDNPGFDHDVIDPRLWGSRKRAALARRPDRGHPIRWAQCRCDFRASIRSFTGLDD